jgi:hypothetical protein
MHRASIGYFGWRPPGLSLHEVNARGPGKGEGRQCVRILRCSTQVFSARELPRRQGARLVNVRCPGLLSEDEGHTIPTRLGHSMDERNRLRIATRHGVLRDGLGYEVPPAIPAYRAQNPSEYWGL